MRRIVGFDRHGVETDDSKMSYSELKRDWRCKCGAPIVLRCTDELGWHPYCHSCEKVIEWIKGAWRA